MPKYIALLRGINVSGHKTIRMEALRASMTAIGFRDVSTYIQSGNVVFVSDKDSVEVEKLIREKILSDFGHEVSAIVLTPSDLATAVAENPFSEKTTDDSTQPYINFLSEVPSRENIDKLAEVDFNGDEWQIIGKRIYLWYANSAANTKLSNAVIERKLKVVATARNWKTAKKLLALSL